MPVLDGDGRPLPPATGDEVASALGFLEFQRATLAWKCSGLDAGGLAARIPTSSMTLGGLLVHMAFVEDHWFSGSLHANDRSAPWSSVDWRAHPDWDWEHAADLSPEEIRTMWETAVERSRTLVDEALADGGLDQLAQRSSRHGPAPSLRWIVLHMIEEYARHNGHADLLREAVDGAVGE